MPASGLNGIALGGVAVGSIFVWAGIRGYSIPTTIQDLVTGRKPTGQANAYPVGSPVASTGSADTGTPGTSNSRIANDALSYAGHAYLFGGAPGPNGTDPWDCSSFCNWVLGHDFGMPLPGGVENYDGADHGPDTLEYLAWSGAVTVGHDGNSAQAGDLCVWQTHMGIATGANQMISAEDPANGTRVSPINGQIPEILFVRRIVNVTQAGPQVHSFG